MNFKIFTLNDVCLKITDGSHTSPKAKEKGYPMFSVKDMKEYSFDYSNVKLISSEDFEKMKRNDCVPQKGDVLVAKDGSYLKSIFVCKETKEEAILSSIAIFRPNTDIITSDYLCYLLKSPKIFKYISDNCVSGSALPRIILKDFKRVEISVPSIKIQNKISRYLRMIDDKIELNHQINNNLEKQAQAIFKSWFVDFEPFKDEDFIDSELGQIPKGWQVDILKNISKDIICGKTPSTKNKSYFGNEIPFITIPDMHNNVYITKTQRNLSKEGALSQKSKFLPINSICVSCIATAGLVSLTSEISQTNQQINSIIVKEGISYIYVYLLLQRLSEYINILGSSGSTTNNLNKEQFSKIKIIVPNKKVQNKFQELLEPLFEKILKNKKEIENLEKLRDTLLPKLMSGEIDIPLEV